MSQSSPAPSAALSVEMRDPRWRIHNLYKIRSAAGPVIPFRPNPQQDAVIKAIHVRGHRRIVIIKARQLGFSTLLGVLATDFAMFNQGMQISIIDQSQRDAQQKLKGITSLSFNSTPDPLRLKFDVLRENAGELAINQSGASITKASTIYAGMHARGGTNNLLWISEWGVIQAKDATRSEEILTGAIPSAKEGIVVVETTWMGGRGGHLWEIVKTALETPEEMKGPDDWRVLFFPWQDDGNYSDPTPTPLTPESVKYFAEKERETGVTFSASQKTWWQKTKAMFGIFMGREYPTTMEECFRAPVEGAIYADLIDKLRASGSIRPAQVDGSALVHTFWDIGSPLNTATWYVQLVGPEIRVIDFDSGLDLTTMQRVARILGKGYPLGQHFLPHDAAAKLNSGRTVQFELEEAGLRNVRVVPRTVDVWIGINRLRQLLPRMTFRTSECDTGLNALTAYRVAVDIKTGAASDQPVHDWASHPADALRQLAEAEMAGMLIGGSETARQSRQGMKPRVIMGLRDVTPTRKPGVIR